MGFSKGARTVDEAAEYFMISSFIKSPRKNLKKFKAEYKEYKAGKIKISKDEVFGMGLEIKKAKGHFE